MWPLSTVTEPKRFRVASACALSSVPQPHCGYSAHNGICANTTTGVDADLPFRSSSIHLSCSSPRLPMPPPLRLATLTRPMTCSPLASKLYQPCLLSTSDADDE